MRTLLALLTIGLIWQFVLVVVLVETSPITSQRRG
jgi:hypothetical protein